MCQPPFSTLSRMFCQPKGEPSRGSDEEPSRKASQEAAPGRVVFQIGGGRTLQASGGVRREQKPGGKNAPGLSGECKTEERPRKVVWEQTWDQEFCTLSSRHFKSFSR